MRTGTPKKKPPMKRKPDHGAARASGSPTDRRIRYARLPSASW
jgi:hypothetical protein